MAKKEDEKKIVKEVAQKLLTLMGFKKIKLKISLDEGQASPSPSPKWLRRPRKAMPAARGVFHLDIDCEEPGVLIGHHGETIFSLQLIISLLCYKRLGEWQRILVNVGDWREKRIEALKKMALSATQRVKFSGEEVILPHLNAGERRTIHLYLADHPDVTTESVGEGEERRLVIKPKAKLS